MAETSRGVIYTAWGRDHVEVARRSAASVKKWNPEMGTAIWCKAGDDTSGFDQAFHIPEGIKRPKIELLGASPFDETLYLDNDTMIRADLRPMFDLLRKYELCGAQVILWHRKRHQKPIALDLPESFPEINCGVLLYRKTPAVLTFFDEWVRSYLASGMKIDQPAFRETLWQSDVKFYVLPPQFNKRVFEASELIWSDAPRARILHLELLRPQKNPILRWISNRIR
ncbi:putative nucleotide-diphospho-sugar transferase [Salipiger sp. P9]|uniref:putative nucleotide-diphospho-sugar transferase n=1 Tax=Salipiger pentaromativorans TaxID=2943193 RepID=UPI002157DA41|nr:putative nucleotide-diphospho-sugar transferase [Salipiger pentaromativorans]MCR8550817.1 putative nucleotide-diphospho-sugar transferase [Salipiger pentaromativorans]